MQGDNDVWERLAAHLGSAQDGRYVGDCQDVFRPANMGFLVIRVI